MEIQFELFENDSIRWDHEDDFYFDRVEKQKMRCRKLVAKGVAKGRIIVPEFCEHCGVKDKLEAHHYDYSRPFYIRFLCVDCHRNSTSIEYDFLLSLYCFLVPNLRAVKIIKKSS